MKFLQVYNGNRIRVNNKILQVSDEKNVDLPQDCILLDYFIEDYHFGVKLNRGGIQEYFGTGFSPYRNDVVDGTNYFDLGKSGWSGLPYMRCDDYGEGGARTKSILYDLDLKSLDGYTIEYLLRIQNVSMASFVQCVYIAAAYNFAGLNYNSKSVGSYQVSGSRPSYNYNIGYLSKLIGYNDYASSWHHYAFTKDNVSNKGYYFLDGKMVSQSNNTVLDNSLYIEPCCITTNNGSGKVDAYFDIAQLAVWNYCKYTTSFEVSKKLIGVKY